MPPTLPPPATGPRRFPSLAQLWHWLLLSLALPATAQPAPLAATNPPTLSLTIRCATNEFLLGDPIPVEFVIRNNGRTDAKYEDRNYDRGGRLPEYELTAQTAAGAPVPDAIMRFRPGMMGGLFGEAILHPGESYTKTIPLNLWAAIREPGQYEVTGAYRPEYVYGTNPVTSAPIRIIVRPRSAAEMHAYVQGLTNRLTLRLDYLATHPGGRPPGLADADLSDLQQQLMYTGSAEAVSTLLRAVFASGDHFWAVVGLDDYVPHTAETRSELLAAAQAHGLENLQSILQAHEFTAREMKPLLTRALSENQPDEWSSAVWLALKYYDDDFTPRLIAIANDPHARWDTRSIALRVLAYHRTDAGVQAIKTLLRDPAPDMLRTLYETIANGYLASPDKSPNVRPLRPDDFTPADLRPLIERLLASDNGAYQLQVCGVVLAKQFGSPELIPQLETLSTNADPTIRGCARDALVKLKH